MSRTILHLEIEDSVKELLNALLSARGHKVESLASGKAGLAKIAEENIDLVVVGAELEDIDGISFISKLRASNRNISIIYVSKVWHDAAIYKQLRSDLKVDMVVHRPLKASLLGAQIESIFQEEKKITSHIEQEETIFKTLQANYLKVLPERVKKLNTAIQTAKTNPEDQYSLLEAIRLAHNLKGTASSCGFGVLGESAGSLEKALASIKDNRLEKNEAAWEEIDLMVDLVRSNATVLGGTPSAQVDKRAFSTLEIDPETDMSLPPVSGPPIPQDNFDVFDDSASARVLVVSKAELAGGGVLSTRAGMKVHVLKVSDREEALERAARLTLDAVLIDIDIKLPGPSLNLARELRSLAQYESLPVAFLAGERKEKDLEDSTHAGAALMLSDGEEGHLSGGDLSQAIDYLLSARSGGRPRILLVDDDQDFVHVVASVLGQEGMLVKVVESGARILAEMNDFHPDLLLLDVNMPGLSGYDVCRLVRGESRYHDLPVIVLTAATGLENRLAAFESGADDYLPKPIAKVELLTRVKVRLERSRLLRERANLDVLTGLPIRRAFMEELDKMVQESERNGLIFSLALIDVDHFKQINDSHGHLAGDRVLAALGQLLKKRFRVEDIRGRWGGEEFIVAFRHIPRNTARGALQRALEELSKLEFKGDRDESFSISFSSGIVEYPAESKDLSDLLRRSDEKLYRAKEAGRNCIIA